MDGTRIPKKKKETRKYSINDETIEVLGVAPSLISKTQASSPPVQSQPIWAKSKRQKKHYHNGGRNGHHQQSRRPGRHFPHHNGDNRRQTFLRERPTMNGAPNGSRFASNFSGPNGWQRNGNNRSSNFGNHCRMDMSSITHSYSHHTSQLPQHINNNHINGNGTVPNMNSYNSNPHRIAQHSRGTLPSFRNHSKPTAPGSQSSNKSLHNKAATFDPSIKRRKGDDEIVPLGGNLTRKHEGKREQNTNPDLKPSYKRLGRSQRILQGKSVITPVANYSIKPKGKIDRLEHLSQKPFIEKNDSNDDQYNGGGTENEFAPSGEKVSRNSEKEEPYAEEENKNSDSAFIQAEEHDKLFSSDSSDDDGDNEVIDLMDSDGDDFSSSDVNEKGGPNHENHEEEGNLSRPVQRQEDSLFSSDSESGEDELHCVDNIKPIQQRSEESATQTMENESNSPIFFSESENDGNPSDDQSICRFKSTRLRSIHDSGSSDNESDEELLIDLRKNKRSGTNPERRRNKRRQWEMIAKSNKDTTNVKDTIVSAIVNSSNELPEDTLICWTKLDDNARKFLGCEGIKNVLLENAEQLGKRYKSWRDQNGFVSLKYSHTLLVSRWQAVFREGQMKAKVKSLSAEKKVPTYNRTRRKRKYSDPDELGCMLDVPFLTRREEGENGMPIKYITVKNFKDGTCTQEFGASDFHLLYLPMTTDTLYDFRIDIRKSTIPNSGNGAFLTFLGARVLKSRIRSHVRRLKKNRVVVSVLTTNHLEAHIDEVTKAVVTIRGENIHGNGNSPYFPLTRFPLKANLPTGEKIHVRLGPKHIHEDIDQLKQNKEIPAPENAIGYLGVLDDSDFESKSSARFCSHDGCGLIDLGRYGPFTKEDRKTELEFNFKEFAYDVEPTCKIISCPIFSNLFGTNLHLFCQQLGHMVYRRN